MANRLFAAAVVVWIGVDGRAVMAQQRGAAETPTTSKTLRPTIKDATTSAAPPPAVKSQPNAAAAAPSTPKRNAVMSKSAAIRYEPVAFARVPGWAGDNHKAAFDAFVKSCLRIATLTRESSTKFDAGGEVAQNLIALCAVTLAVAPEIRSQAMARQFFEQHFVANRVVHGGPDGLLTGYYEPVIEGSRTPQGKFAEPIYRRPGDLVNLVEEAKRGDAGAKLTHARKTPAGIIPFPTRGEIDGGALKGRNLELLYLADPVEVFFLQVQGSGQIRLPDGKLVRVSYDGKNGHPYTSIGRYLIDKGIIDAARMSLKALGDWLKADLKRGREIMQQNKSYVFFRELTDSEANAALGVLDIPLTDGRSLAIDAGQHSLGLPVYVSSDTLTHATANGGFHRLMIAQDVGSAIKGPERGDIFFGAGDGAGKLAGITKHRGTFFVLTPKPAAAARATSAIGQAGVKADVKADVKAGGNTKPTKTP